MIERRLGRAGFTLIELLVVIGIILILLALALWALRGVQHATRLRAAQADLACLKAALERYRDLHSVWPDRAPDDPKGRCANYEIVRLLQNWRMDTPLGDPSGRNKQARRDAVLDRLNSAQLDANGNWRDPWGSPYAITLLPENVWSLYQKTILLRNLGRACEWTPAEKALAAPYGASEAHAQYWVSVVRAQTDVYSLGPNRACDSGNPSGDDVRP